MRAKDLAWMVIVESSINNKNNNKLELNKVAKYLFGGIYTYVANFKAKGEMVRILGDTGS